MTNVSFSPSGPPETILPPPEPDLVSALRENDPATAAARFPESPLAWAALGDQATADDPNGITAYAYYRVGYHRGLDLLRRHGWKGSGYVRWEHESNHGFLRCLEGLARQAAVIGEEPEAERCQEFLRQLDPTWHG